MGGWFGSEGTGEEGEMAGSLAGWIFTRATETVGPLVAEMQTPVDAG